MEATSSIYKTRFYSDCIGVFQGGGCRGAAFAGAYEAAFKQGVRFSEVAGTSAGSIVAALLAAGAEPNYLISKLSGLDFKALLTEPSNPTFSKVANQIKALSYLPFKGETADAIVKIAKVGGLYSSAGVESWVEGCLKELTGKTNGRVEFQDLGMPLHVVAGDLSTMKARIWSSNSTPHDSVAHAVRSSCSIPVFFQPVEEGSALLVDGGIVSNIPHFLFFGEAMRNVKGRKRVLLFLLQSSEDISRAQDAQEFAFQIASLVVDGGSNVQLAFTPDLARIVIPTGTIKATDFKKIDKAVVATLLENGRQAASRFIEHELLNTQSTSMELRPIADEHEAYLAVSEQLYATKSVVRIAMPDTKWFWELFPTALHWRKNNIRIICLVLAGPGGIAEAAKEDQRRGIMRGLGIEIEEISSLPFHGILFDRITDSSASALTFPLERSDYEPAARFYSGRLDQAALSALHKLFPESTGQSATWIPSIRPIDPALLLARLRENVQFYRNPTVSVAIEEVDVRNVFLISRYVRAFRYKQIGSLVDHYRESGIPLFDPTEVTLSGGGTSFVTPPVVEISGTAFVALEGNTRFLFCLNNEIESINAVVVRGVTAELPGKPIPLKDVRITTQKHLPGERIAGFNRSLFREIERAIRPLPDAI
jgi:predicted acylesterase/phospholipase RssA